MIMDCPEDNLQLPYEFLIYVYKLIFTMILVDKIPETGKPIFRAMNDN